MKKRTLVLAALVLAAAGGIAWQKLRPPEPKKVVTAEAEILDELRAEVKATGEIKAKEFVDIQAEVSGIITEVLVDEGDRVKVGQVLLRLQDLPLRADLDAARAQLGSTVAEAKNAEVGVATAEANLAAEKTVLASLRLELEQARTIRDRAEASFKRKEELFQNHLIGSEEYEVAAADARLQQQKFELSEARIVQGEANVHAATTRVEAAKSTLEGALQRIEAAKASVARAEDLLGKTVLRAPLEGLITKLNVEKGERAVPGIQSNPIATLMTIADMSVIEAEIRVAEADIVSVSLGAEAVVEVDAMRDTEIRGTVTEVGQSPIQAATGSTDQGKDFKVVVRLIDPPPQLRPGFTATARITTGVRHDVLVVPLQAQVEREIELDAERHYVRPAEPVDDELTHTVSAADRRKLEEVEGVFVMRDGRAHFEPVKFGIIGGMDIEVLDGLEAGEVVVIGPNDVIRKLAEWDRIAVDEERQNEDVLRLRRKRR